MIKTNTQRIAVAIILLLIIGSWAAGVFADEASYQSELDQMAISLSSDSELVIVGIGPSIMQNSITGFVPFLSSPEVNDNIIFVDGSLGSNQQRFENPDYFGWDVGINRLPNGLTAADVDIVFYYNALTNPTGTQSEYTQTAADSYEITYGIIADKYPNVQMILHSSQHYAGWCGQCKAPEPYAYYQKFAVDELIRRRIDGEISGPLLARNAYQWDSTWPQNYYTDGLHLSNLGQTATGQLWHDYLSVTSFTAPWYLDGTAPTATPGATGTATVTAVPSNTPTPTETGTPGATPTVTNTPTATPTCARDWCASFQVYIPIGTR